MYLVCLASGGILLVQKPWLVHIPHCKGKGACVHGFTLFVYNSATCCNLHDLILTSPALHWKQLP